MTGPSSSLSRVPATPPDELTPRFAFAERRLTARALDSWLEQPDRPVPGFEAHSLVIVDPGGRAWVETIGTALATLSGLAVGQRLERGPGLLAELSAACDLLALQPLPVPFEAHVAAPDQRAVMLRGIALPIAGRTGPIDRAQIICNWREILNRAATQRIRRELDAALRSLTTPDHPDPFPRRG